ncbi:MAG: class I SAM-dependent RNA methyltransferase [Bacteroidetes bacterium]|nr:class I SAM-dependent RNA methyltransferase [Bacteroidota bacterium]
MDFLDKTFTIIAKTLFGLEEVLLQELQELGAEEAVTITRGVSFRGDRKLLYSCNYASRLALRFLVPIAEFPARDEEELYNRIKRIPWEQYLDIRQTFAIESNIFRSRLNHSKYIALKAKDAIADRFRDKRGQRPSVDTIEPDVRISLHIQQDNCTVLLDSSGSSLHLRGYRNRTSPAPLNEVLAAGMIRLSGWDTTTDFVDPMCGSGTLPIEACLMAMHVPPGKIRQDFGFMKWKNFDADLWMKIRESLDSKILSRPPCRIQGYDNNPDMVSISRTHATSAGVKAFTDFAKRDFFTAEPPYPSGFMITNPPYGERIQVENGALFYKNIGDTLKKIYAGYTAWILSGDMDSLKHLGLKPNKKISLLNGQLECKFQKFELYSGSRKITKHTED